MHLPLSDGLALRPFRKGDEQALVRALDDWRVAQWLARLPYPYQMEDAAAWVSTHEAAGATPPFALCITQYDCLIGGVGLIGGAGLTACDDPGALELGYWLSVPAWGKGIMTKIVTSLLAEVRQRMPGCVIEAGVEPQNSGSANVLTKCGFTETGATTIWSEPRQQRVPLRRFLRRLHG